MAGAAAVAGSLKQLVVFIVFFGELPPWLPLTLESMSSNAAVDFVVIGDAAAPAAVPSNVRFERIGFDEMQVRLSLLMTPGNRSSVRYNTTYKANDIKPLAAVLYPQLVAGHEWWAWADLDVVFGDLLKYFRKAAADPACCKVPLRPDGKPHFTRAGNVYLHKTACPCTHGERVNVVCPLYPNPWRKMTWGPFTAFRTGPFVLAGGTAAGKVLPWQARRQGASAAAAAAGASPVPAAGPVAGTALYTLSQDWRGVIGSNEYAHFDEWWGPFHYSRGWETMGDVLTRLAEADGAVIMSRQKMPFAEAKSCRDAACMFCPCGATRMQLESGALRVNGLEVMLLHLAESKYAWAASGVSLEPWSAGPGSRYRKCQAAVGLGRMNASCGATCTARAPIFSAWDEPGAIARATRLTRHRVQNKWAGHIKYATRRDDVRLRVGSCDELQSELAGDRESAPVL